MGHNLCVAVKPLLCNVDHLGCYVLCCYESKFILDSFIFRVSPARFLRRLAAIINIFPRSRVTLVTYLASTRWDFKNGWPPTSTFFHSHMFALVTYLASTQWDFKGWLLSSTFSHGHMISCCWNYGRRERHPSALLAIQPNSYPNLLISYGETFLYPSKMLIYHDKLSICVEKNRQLDRTFTSLNLF